MGLFLPVISGLVAALVVYLLSNAVKGEPEQRGSRNWVEYGVGYKSLSLAFFPASAFVTYAALQASPDQKTLALIIAALFWAATLYLAYEFFFVHLSYNDEFVYHRTPLRGQRRIPWNAVNDVRYSAATQSFTLKTYGYGDVSISPYTNGSKALVQRARARLEADHHERVGD
jgi:hypothetical protein